jgi:hypothetical protein
MLDDEDDYLPDFSIPSLEKNRVFASLGLSRGIVRTEISKLRIRLLLKMLSLLRLKKVKKRITLLRDM